MSARRSLFWNVYMDNIGYQRDGEWQFNVFSAMRYEVSPPTVKLVERILKCSEKTKIYNKTAPSEKYQKLVNSKSKSLVGRLIHRYCDVCSTTNKTLKLDEKKELQKILGAYPVLTSFMPLTNTFDLHVLPLHAGFKNTFWKSMTCSNINTNKDSLVCKIDKCLDQVWRTERGQCKFPHLLKLAVLEEEQLISTIFVNQLTFYVECYLTLYAGYEIVNMWNDTEVVYNPRFEKVFYVTRYIVLFDYTKNIYNDDEEMLLQFIHYAKLIRSLSAIRARMATKDLQRFPDLRSINSLDFEDLENMYLIHNYFRPPAINTLNGTKQQLLPVCAYLSTIISNKVKNLPEVELLCAYALKYDDAADVKTTELNSCLDILKYSNQRESHCSGTFTHVFRLLSLIIINHICMIEII
ncbi:hypothetical protein Bpfe_001621 [Biomphalaria pfeifferi]|uniref:Uncharacterized protein n=1 Tax=Biomphalaria pfeifferi TaxID=112525 RepID=A0AAD8FLT2_BIOPF|nr:hypothetical protein Bpfe_001621 [Biomphalaria pfeifferi]